MRQNIIQTQQERLIALKNARETKKSYAFTEIVTTRVTAQPQQTVGPKSPKGEGKHKRGKHHHNKQKNHPVYYAETHSADFKGSDTGVVLDNARMFKGRTRPLTDRQAQYLCSVGIM